MFDDNTEMIVKLPFSAKQIKYMNGYVDSAKVSIVFLEGSLKQAGGDADKFFDVFKATTNLSSYYPHQKVLKKFFLKNAESIKKLPFSAKQIKYMNGYIDKAIISIIFLGGVLERAEGDADTFFAIFKATTNLSSYYAHQRVLKEFFLENAEAILSLGLSAKQIRYMDSYIDVSSVSAKLLEASFKTNKANCADNIETLF